MLGIYLQRALVVLYSACIPISFIFLYMEKFLLLLGQDPEVSEKAGEYALFLLPSLYAYALLQPVVKFLQTQSLVIPMMICSAGTLLLHLGISHTLIYRLGFGFHGAAMATSLSFWLNAILLVLYMRFSGLCKETWEGFTSDAFVDLREFLSLAIPSCIMIWWVQENCSCLICHLFLLSVHLRQRSWILFDEPQNCCNRYLERWLYAIWIPSSSQICLAKLFHSSQKMSLSLRFSYTWDGFWYEDAFFVIVTAWNIGVLRYWSYWLDFCQTHSLSWQHFLCGMLTYLVVESLVHLGHNMCNIN